MAAAAAVVTACLRPPPPSPSDGGCYPAAGEGVHVFVLDTGCRPGHEQLHPRAAVTAAPGSPYASGVDDFGHGTHVASIIAGRDLGVAPRCRVTCLKALSATNDGSSADVISAIGVVTAWAAAHPRSPVVMSVSLGVAASRWFTALDGAINGAYHAGVLPVISAGNAGRDACAFTPARAAHALTVAALDGGGGRVAGSGGCPPQRHGRRRGEGVGAGGERGGRRGEASRYCGRGGRGACSGGSGGGLDTADGRRPPTSSPPPLLRALSAPPRPLF